MTILSVNKIQKHLKFDIIYILRKEGRGRLNEI